MKELKILEIRRVAGGDVSCFCFDISCQIIYDGAFSTGKSIEECCNHFCCQEKQGSLYWHGSEDSDNSGITSGLCRQQDVVRLPVLLP